MKIDCREEVNGFFFSGDASKLEGAYHKAPICGTDREYVDIYSNEQDVDLIFKYKSNEVSLEKILEFLECRAGTRWCGGDRGAS